MNSQMIKEGVWRGICCPISEGYEAIEKATITQLPHLRLRS